MLTELLDVINLSLPELGYVVLCVLLGALIKGYSGFGASIFWVVSVSLALPPIQVVPMVLMFEVISSFYLLPGIWKDIQWKSISTLMIGTCIGTPLGIYALASLPDTTIRMALAVTVLTTAMLLLRGFTLDKVPGKSATVGVGFLAGILNGSMSIGGPPVVLFYFSTPIGIAVSRASIIAYFIGIDALGAAMLSSQGLIDISVFWRTALLIPLLLLGTFVGNRGYKKSNPDRFKKTASYIWVFLSIMLLIRVGWAL
ncbi:MAG: putative membrane protein YfcA [Urechidicola sp.]|jgi:uncharacterized membrane protein YfcA